MGSFAIGDFVTSVRIPLVRVHAISYMIVTILIVSFLSGPRIGITTAFIVTPTALISKAFDYHKNQQQNQQHRRDISSQLQYSSLSTVSTPHFRRLRHDDRNRKRIQTQQNNPKSATQQQQRREYTGLFSVATVVAAGASSSSSSSIVATAPVAAAAATAAVLMSAISGGIMSGGLHAIAGPDHIAALLPRCIGQRWYRAIRVGTIWGIGHGISATILGCVAFIIKRITIDFTTTTTATALVVSSNPLSASLRNCFQFLSSNGSSVMEIAVGISLIVIGSMGIREARDFDFSDTNDSDAIDLDQSSTTTKLHNLSAAVNVAHIEDDKIMSTSKTTTTMSQKPSLRTTSILLNGILHGFSWDGAPSLAPALALMTWGHTITFLSSYALGTTITMAFVTTLIGEGTRRASQIFQRPDLPQKFSYASSILAISIGVIWCVLGLR